MRRSIGIFLGFAPTHLKGNQGITRALLSLLKSLGTDDKVVIALPTWGREELSNLLRESQIDTQNIELLSPSKKKTPHFAYLQ